ncbi:thioredoxin domain-containing protein [Candidatus Woesebacteria bacterium]|nr:MAG: thioredoxin domain-containing protein [Candidatus Woesebacteria bacterium]
MDDLTKKEKRELAKKSKHEEKVKSKLMGKIIKLGLAVLVLSIISFFGYKGIKWINTPIDIPADVTMVQDDEWVKGPKEASVTLIEYADYQCPACAGYHPIVRQLAKEFPDDLRVVYRHFPLTTIHANAFSAAKAAEAAGKQGKFWEMHDMLYERQSQWSEGSAKEKFVEFAQELALDVDKFKEDLDSSQTEERVSVGIALGNKTGVNATPTFILDGVMIRPPQDIEQFRALINQRLGN